MATNIKEIVDVFLESKGVIRQKWNDGDITPLLPLLIMDSALELFNKAVKPVECKREMKMYKNQWKKLYHEFNMTYFLCFLVHIACLWSAIFPSSFCGLSSIITMSASCSILPESRRS